MPRANMLFLASGRRSHPVAGPGLRSSVSPRKSVSQQIVADVLEVVGLHAVPGSEDQAAHAFNASGLFRMHEGCCIESVFSILKDDFTMHEGC